ncbi:long-chain fatty acid--CoA ligase [Delftia acidovorans]|uniref:long-chain fatty acid--CoA ligase n=1 Tax=Delftia acidovorans TaxID=80866 RepID=UPI0018D73269|nr:long-chain fatty acid--CoA ligase [Delftia acidovorans]MCG3782917.1 long-chain fatty acid--CoA ligase [Delftia acidovorans]QPR34342.1 long-chain fatty acid--CoA ligase [Delftia acidovorans]
MPSQPAHHAFWPSRLPHSITVPATSVWDNLAVNARRYPDKAAIRYFGSSISYRELCEGTERMAAYLHSLGVQRGDRVILLMQNTPQLILAHYAIFRANAVVVPVNPMNMAEELRHYITDADAKVAITTADLAPELAKASNALAPGQRLEHLVVTQFTDAFDAGVQGDDAPPVQWHDWLLTRREPAVLDGGSVHTWQQALACTDAAPPHVVGRDDMAVLPYTSGTTGHPKGCMHPHRSINHNAVAGSYWGSGTSETVVLAVVPMFHITGMVSVLHTAIFVGATLVVMPRWDRELAGRLISRYQVTSWTNIPTMVIDLLGSPNFAQFDLTSLKYIGGGGAAMPQAVAQRLLEQYGLRFSEGYGLTETAAPTHSNPFEHPKQQCLGIPFMSTEARVIDPETGADVPQGEQGEIVVHGPEVFDGYWKRPDATAQVFMEIDGKRFFRTGDLGHVDEDGYYFITDRLKRMINASGFKVWPAEVESLMFRHPAIQEACVISTRDSYRGESVKAVVVLRAGKEDTTAEDIIQWCRENMAVYKAPKIVQFVKALPKSGSGKVMWRQLQEAEAG